MQQREHIKREHSFLFFFCRVLHECVLVCLYLLFVCRVPIVVAVSGRGLDFRFRSLKPLHTRYILRRRKKKKKKKFNAHINVCVCVFVFVLGGEKQRC